MPADDTNKPPTLAATPQSHPGGAVSVLLDECPARVPAWETRAPSPRSGPDAVILPEGQIADILPDGLVDALLEAQPSSAALDARWRAARDAFLASMDAAWGQLILDELTREIARRRDGARESAKDLRQIVLLVISRKYEEHVGETGEAWEPEDPRAFLRCVARNVARNHARMKGRRPAIERDVEVDAAPAAAPDPEQATINAELLAMFESKRGELTPQEAEVFEGRAALGLTFQVLAALLERPITTVQSQYARAVDKLRGLLRAAA